MPKNISPSKREGSEDDSIAQPAAKKQKSSKRSAEARISPASSSDGSEMTTSRQKAVVGVLASIQDTPDEIDVIQGGFVFLGGLLRSNKEKSLMKYVFQADGISLITSAIKSNLHAGIVQENGRVLLGLVCKQVREATDKEGIKAVLDIMKQLPDDTGLLTGCCDTLWKAATNGFREFIGEEEGIPLVLSALKNHPDEEEFLLPCALRSLIGLTVGSDSNRDRAAKSGGIEVVIETMKRHSQNIRSCNGIAVLQNLACNSRDRANSLVAMGAPRILAAYMTNHPENEYVQHSACSAIANMSYNCGATTVQDRIVAPGDVVPAIVKAMNQHPDSVKVQIAACGALRVFSEGDKAAARDMIIDSGALEAVSSAIRRHRQNKDVVMLAQKTWVNLNAGCFADSSGKSISL